MKIIEISDVHLDPSKMDEIEKDIDKVIATAKSEGVSAIISSGDFFNKAFIASSQNKWDRVLRIARKMQSTCQVYFIQGTPSHDSPGAYDSLIDIGFKEINAGKSHKIGNLMIAGIQEINPNFIIAKHPELSKQDAIARQYELVDDLIDNYYIPFRESHVGPFHFALHGHISGAKFKADQKPRTSEFMFMEQTLAKLKADRIQAGHLHLPQKFENLNAEYVGSFCLTWGDTGFVPGFNIVEYSDTALVSVRRVNLDKPERQKITIKDFSNLPNFQKSTFQAKYAATDLWIEVKCDRAFADQFDTAESLNEIREKILIGPLSKITLDIQHEEHTRVDVDEYEACATLEDLYKIYDPAVSKSTLLKVKEAEEATGQSDQVVKNQVIDLQSVYLKGSKAGMENGVEEISVDFSEFKTGANLLTGPNGTGKSFLLGFCTPYSQHIPTGSDLKSLFDLKDSQILRKFIVNGQTVTQKIVIDPTLSSPTAKYYMDIDGVACPGVTGNKAPFDEAVLEMFGSLKMFMACVFKGQKESKEFPSLENSKESDLRQIFTELSGIDRTPLKEYAGMKAKELARGIELDSREIETLEGMVKDEDEIQKDIHNSESFLEKAKIDSRELSDKLNTVKKALSAIEADKQSNDSVNSLISSQRSVFEALKSDTYNIECKIDDLKLKLNNIDKIRTDLKGLQDEQKAYTKLSEQFLQAQSEYNTEVSAYNQKKSEIDSELLTIQERAEEKKRIIATHGSYIQKYETRIKGYEDTMLLINKPCEHCGKLSSTAEAELKTYQERITDDQFLIDEAVNKIAEMQKSVDTEKNNYRTVRDRMPSIPVESAHLVSLREEYNTTKVDTVKITALENILTEAESSSHKITELEAELKQKSDRMTEVDAEIQGLKGKLIPISENRYLELQREDGDLNSQIINLTTEVGRLTAEISGLEKSLEENQSRVDKIGSLKAKCKNIQADVTEWEAVRDAFAPKGIVALELSLLAPLIDRESNRLLKSNGTRFRTEIITQDLDSTGKRVLEKFKILVHDSRASEVKNLPNCSPGQLAWISTAIQDAIAIEAQKRTGRTWQYCIKDEPDSALDLEAVSDFYSMLDIAMDGQRKLLSVSHSPVARELIGNTQEITDFMKGYGGECNGNN